MSHKITASNETVSIYTVLNWNTFNVCGYWIKIDGSAQNFTVKCIAESIESAIEHVRRYGIPSHATIKSVKVCPHGVMIAA